ncbi:ABC transporter permease [Micromonospora sp. NPDC005113]
MTADAPVRSAWPGGLRASARSGRIYGPLRALGLLVIVYAAFAVMAPNFATTFNTRSLLAFAVPALLVAIGQTFVIALGEIDLSVASVAALSGIVFILNEPHGLPLAFGAAALTGLGAGLFNGLVTAFLRVPSMVTTLAMLFIAQGLAYLFADEPVTGTRIDLTVHLEQPIGSLLTPRILIGLGVAVVAAVALGRTTWGRSVFGRGAHPRAARLLALPDRSLVVTCLVLSGLLSAAAGVVTSISLNSASPVIGGDLLLLGIAACLIGGSRLEGGTGSVVGTAFALLALLALQNGMDQVGVNAYVQQVIRGCVVLVALLAAAPASVGGIRLGSRLTLRRTSPDVERPHKAPTD